MAAARAAAAPKQAPHTVRILSEIDAEANERVRATATGFCTLLFQRFLVLRGQSAGDPVALGQAIAHGCSTAHPLVEVAATLGKKRSKTRAVKLALRLCLMSKSHLAFDENILAAKRLVRRAIVLGFLRTMKYRKAKERKLAIAALFAWVWASVEGIVEALKRTNGQPPPFADKTTTVLIKELMFMKKEALLKATGEKHLLRIVRERELLDDTSVGLSLPPMPSGQVFRRSGGATHPHEGLAEAVAACVHDSPHRVLQLLTSVLGADVYKDVDRRSQTPGRRATVGDNALASAVRGGNAAVVRLLLALSADPNCADCCPEGLTPLQLAVTELQNLPDPPLLVTSSAYPHDTSKPPSLPEHEAFSPAVRRTGLNKVVVLLLGAGGNALASLPSGEELFEAVDPAAEGSFVPYMLRHAQRFAAMDWNETLAGSVPCLRPVHFSVVGHPIAKLRIVDAVQHHFATMAAEEDVKRSDDAGTASSSSSSSASSSSSGKKDGAEEGSSVARKPLVIMLPCLPGHGSSLFMRSVAEAIVRPGDGIGDNSIGGDRGIVTIELGQAGTFKRLFGYMGMGLLDRRLYRYSGRPAVVILDGLDRVRQVEVFDALAAIFRDGVLNSVATRAEEKRIDCSRMVFLATTAWLPELTAFHAIRCKDADTAASDLDQLLDEDSAITERYMTSCAALQQDKEGNKPLLGMLRAVDHTIILSGLPTQACHALATQMVLDVVSSFATYVPLPPPRTEDEFVSPEEAGNVDFAAMASQSSSSGPKVRKREQVAAADDILGPAQYLDPLLLGITPGIISAASATYNASEGGRAIVAFARRIVAATVAAVRSGKLPPSRRLIAYMHEPRNFHGIGRRGIGGVRVDVTDS